MDDFKMFTVGPVQMYEHTLRVRANNVPYFRTDEFSEMMMENEHLMKKIVGAEEDSEVVFLTASGSGAMEATVINCFDANDPLLIISGGTFGERFEKICSTHGLQYDVLRLGEDEKLEACRFEEFRNKNYIGLLVNLHETYTGQLYDVRIIQDFCRQKEMLLVVDAISTFLCDSYDMKKYGIDVTIISSQKGLCLAPGLSFVILGKRMLAKMRTVNPNTLYFDFKDYIENMKRGQTPFTPAVGICYELNDMLHRIEEEGLEKRIAMVQSRADYFRKRLKLLNVNLPPYPLSNALTPIRFQNKIAKELYLYLKNEKKIVVNPVGGELGARSVRVAHIGDLQFSDYDLLIDEIGEFLRGR